MAKIREDASGLYLVVNGGKYRPEVSRHNIGSVWKDGKPIMDRWPTIATAGETVKASHIAQSCMARVKVRGAVEIWSRE